MRKTLIHAFVFFHVAAVVAFSFSATEPRAPLEKALRKRVGRYLFPLGLWQSWIMFAPNPAMANAYLEAEVTFRDGARATWTFPRMERMGYFERFRKERYRKWATERVSWMGGKPDPALAEAAARFAARRVSRGADNPPRTVELVRHWAPIPPPTRHGIAPHRAAPTGWERQSIATCHFDDEGAITKVEGPPTRASTSQPSAGESAVSTSGDGGAGTGGNAK